MTRRKRASVTVSHLRFGPQPIRSPYLITKASFVACHQFQFHGAHGCAGRGRTGRDVSAECSVWSRTKIWNHLPRQVQETIIQKKLKFYVIDAYKVARETGMGSRINTIMQTCFFAISGVLPREEAIAAIKNAIRETYGKRGEAVVQKNFAAVDQTLAHLHEVNVPRKASSGFDILPPVSRARPEFVRNVLGPMIAGSGDILPVSAHARRRHFPDRHGACGKSAISRRKFRSGTNRLCIQCGKCVLVCPHAVIRAKVYDSSLLANAPATFKSAKPRWREFEILRYTLQVAPEDCTGCELCVEVCPAKSKSEVKHKAINMAAAGAAARSRERELGFLPVAAGIRTATSSPTRR